MTPQARASQQTVLDAEEPNATPTQEQRASEEIVAAFLTRVRTGDNWFLSLLNAVAEWNEPNEEANDRTYTYVVAGEAFDWLLLAERLIGAAGDLIPEGEATRLLFEGRAPIHIDAELFRSSIGHGKHAAHLNFLYGVVVEEALQQANIEEVAKAQQSLGARENSIEDEAMNRLYGAPAADLRTEFRLALRKKKDIPVRSSLDEYKSFVYWLFKRRVARSDPARLASDTRKGLLVLERIRPALWQWSQGENN